MRVSSCCCSSLPPRGARNGRGSDDSLLFSRMRRLATYGHESPRAAKLTHPCSIGLWREDHGETEGTVIPAALRDGRVLAHVAASPENR